MLGKIAFWLVWIGFIAYAFLLAPPDSPDTFELIKNLSTGNWEGINPWIICLFNIMGVWPIIYSCLLCFDGRGQKIPAWPFAALSFGVGAFGILPYLGLREPHPVFAGSKDSLLRALDSRLTGFVIALGAIALVIYGLLKGDFTDFILQWQTSRFIHVMSLDFCLLSVLFPALLGDDLARREMQNSVLFWVATLVPFFGAIVYLCLRKPLSEVGEDV